MGALARSICAVLAAGLLASACGTADREADVIAAADGFHAALEERDGAGACAHLTADTAATVEREEKRPCSEAILDLELPAGARAAGAEVYVTSGYADLRGSGPAFLDQGPDGWRIAAAGCSPSSPDRPYDCELGG